MLLLLSSLALADIPPPPGYVEKCTIAKQCGPDEEGAKCDAYYGGREPCERLEAEGWTKKCRTGGASVWDEVFCRPKGSGKPASPDGEGASPSSAESAPSEAKPSAASDGAATPEPAPPPTKPEAPVEEEEARRCSTVPSGLAGLWAVLLGAGVIRRRSSCEGNATC